MNTIDLNNFMNYNPVITEGIIPYDYEKFLKDDSISSKADPAKVQSLNLGPIEKFDSIEIGGKKYVNAPKEHKKLTLTNILGVVGAILAGVTAGCILKRPAAALFNKVTKNAGKLVKTSNNTATAVVKVVADTAEDKTAKSTNIFRSMGSKISEFAKKIKLPKLK